MGWRQQRGTSTTTALLLTSPPACDPDTITALLDVVDAAIEHVAAKNALHGFVGTDKSIVVKAARRSNVADAALRDALSLIWKEQ